MRLIDPILAELDQEAKTTRKFLEALPADKMGWKPHEKSMSAGQLAMHIATIPGQMSDMAKVDEFSMGAPGPKEEPTKEAILAAFEKNLAHAKEVFNTFDDAKMASMWKFTMNGKTIMEVPRVGMLRSFIMNHLYHHRGQFGVYLRLVGAHVPSSYGPSGDDNPFAKLMEMAGQA